MSVTAIRPETRPEAGASPAGDLAFYHDGRFATLRDVVDHYDAFFGLGLTEGDIADLIQ